MKLTILVVDVIVGFAALAIMARHARRRRRLRRAPDADEAAAAGCAPSPSCLVQLRVDGARGLGRQAGHALELLLRSRPGTARPIRSGWSSARRRAGPTPSERVEDRLARARRPAAGGGTRARSGAPRRGCAGAAAARRVRGRAGPDRAVRARTPPPRASRARSPRRAAGRTPASPPAPPTSWPLPPSMTTRFGAGGEALVVLLSGRVARDGRTGARPPRPSPRSRPARSSARRPNLR